MENENARERDVLNMCVFAFLVLAWTVRAHLPLFYSPPYILLYHYPNSPFPPPHLTNIPATFWRAKAAAKI